MFPGMKPSGMKELPPMEGMEDEMPMDAMDAMDDMDTGTGTAELRDGSLYCGKCGCKLFSPGSGEGIDEGDMDG